MTIRIYKVSSKTQHIDRQLSEIVKLNIPTKHIFIDKESG